MNFNFPPTSPIAPLEGWFQEAETAATTSNPLAMALSTVNSAGIPSARMVLLKSFDKFGAVFYTNYISEKSNEIEANSNVSLLFHWDTTQRQIRIQGRATRLCDEESDAYFTTRNRLSQVSAWSSKQSQPLKSRAILMANVATLTEKWIGRSVPRPEFWGGYRVSLDTIELWQGHDGRLHDRIAYTKVDGEWSWERLQP